jgi:hypothetical protein
MVVKRGKPIGYRTSNECNSWFFRDLGGAHHRAERKTMAKNMTREISKRSKLENTILPCFLLPMFRFSKSGEPWTLREQANQKTHSF